MVLSQLGGLNGTPGMAIMSNWMFLFFAKYFSVVFLLNEQEDCITKMKININKKNLEDFTIDDFELLDYNPHDAIRAPIAV